MIGKENIPLYTGALAHDVLGYCRRKSGSVLYITGINYIHKYKLIL